MRYEKSFALITATLFMVLMATSSFAIPGQERMRPANEMEPWFTNHTNDKTDDQKIVLASGDTSYCGTDFMLENLGDEMAQVQVIMGNGANYHWDRLPPKGTKGYKLQPGGSLGFPNADHVSVSQARIINSTTADSKVNVVVHCIR